MPVKYKKIYSHTRTSKAGKRTSVKTHVRNVARKKR